MQQPKIDSKNIEDILPLSPMQEGFLFQYLLNPESDQYFEQLTLDICGNINYECFEKTWLQVIMSNEMLRTTFKWEKVENPIQIVLKNVDLPIQFIDLSKEKDQNRIIDELKEKDRQEKFDLQKGPAFRVMLFKLNHGLSRMVISNHHIIFDGWSTGIILREFIETYRAITEGNSIKIASKPKYKEYLKWLKEKRLVESLEFWREYLNKFLEKTPLPIDNTKKRQIFKAKIYKFSIPKVYANKLSTGTKENKVTLSALIYTCWGILLQKYTSSFDIVFGITVSGRPTTITGIEQVVGLFINTIPLRITTTDNDNLISLVQKVQKELLVLKEHESTPLPDIQGCSQLRTEESLFDSIIVVENYPLSQLLNSRLEPRIENYQMTEMTNFDLTLSIVPRDGIEIEFSYNAEVFNESSIERFATHLTKLLTDFCSFPEVKLTQIELLSDEEKRQILHFTDSKMDYPRNQTITNLFDEQVEKNPDVEAVVYKDKHFTYRELNSKANNLAGLLVQNGVKTNDIIGIMVERSPEAIIGILGVLKAGGAYLPIDPQYPLERINYLLKDSTTKILITHEHLLNKVDFAGQVITFDMVTGDKDLPVVKRDITPDDLVYVIYTSGSTGNPKGVLVRHRNFVNIFYAWRSVFKFDQIRLTLLQVASFSFDVFAADFGNSLLNGGKMVICPEEYLLEYPKLYNLIQEHQINLIDSTPAVLLPFMEYIHQYKLSIDSVKFLILGADICLMKDFKRLNLNFGEHMRIINSYGVTETTIDCSFYEEDYENLPDVVTVPIGKPYPNVQIYILGRNMELQPMGITGEIYIGGEGVAAGYINKPELTREKFVPNPLKTSDWLYKTSDWLYKTGDLGRWLPDGNIEFLGRKDLQVKIRGFRIELGEIETQIKRYPDITDAIVVCWYDDQGEAYLTAFIVGETELKVSELRKALKEKLPDYMVPAYFVKLPSMPLTPNKKIDRKALSEWDINLVGGKEYVEPRNEIERKLQSIWARLLPVKKIGIYDKFMEIGGNSLKVIRLTNIINREFDTNLKVQHIFQYPTISDLAEFLSSDSEQSNLKLSDSNFDNYNLNNTLDEVKYTDFPIQSDTSVDKEKDIAIIGIACRFPEAENLEQFYTNLAMEKDSIREFPESRIRELEKFFGCQISANFIREGYLDQITYFEPEIFGINQEESKYIDPQQRLLLELVEEAILDAGYNPEVLSGSNTGVFITGSENEYADYIDLESIYAHFNRVPASSAGRVAYTYNLYGPTLTIDTACSSALVAIHYACQSLKLGEIDYAIVGGTRLIVTPPDKTDLQKSPIASLSQKAKAFDKDADGTIGGEGGGVFLLKTLKQALTDEDNIHAVIKGSAVNSDGGRSNGINAPSVAGQAEVIVRAIKKADIDPLTISYIECHGTGTKIGDPIEIEGLSTALKSLGYKQKTIPIGSVKTNIGHLDTVAGMAGLIKTVLSLKKKKFFPSINFKEPNPLIDFEKSPVFVNQKLTEWTSIKKRRAGVTSLGIIGTNAHIVLEEAPFTKADENLFQELLTPDNDYTKVSSDNNNRTGGLVNFQIGKNIIILSARTTQSLSQMIENLKCYLKDNLNLSIRDVAYTLNTGRRKFSHRMIVVADSIEELINNLENKKYIIYQHGIGQYVDLELLAEDLNDLEKTIIKQLVEDGVDYDWQKVYGWQKRQRVSLPGYIFDRKSYFVSAKVLPAHVREDSHLSIDSINSNQQLETEKENQGATLKPIRTQVIEMLTELYTGDNFDENSDWFDLALGSLAVMHFVGRVKQRYGVELSITQFFENVKVSDLINQITQIIESKYQNNYSIHRQPDRDYYPVSSAQKRQYILNQLDPDSISYNMPGVMIVEGDVDKEKISNTFLELIKRHDALRTSFEVIDGKIVQKVHREVEFTLKYTEIKTENSEETCKEAFEKNIKKVIKEFVKPFDLSTPPLFRAELIKTDRKHLLLMDIHHIVSDGKSVNILTEEFIRLYQDESLPDLPLQYRDFAVWQNELFASEKIKKQEEYWLKTFAGEIPLLDLPTDFPRPSILNHKGNRFHFQINADLTKKVHDLVTLTETTLYMFLLAVYSILLSKYTAQEDIIMGTPVLGRPHWDLEKVIGIFVNTLAMRNYPEKNKTFLEFIKEVKDNSLKAYENQDYPLELLIEKLDIERQFNRNPIFDTVFAMENFATGVQKVSNLTFTPYQMDIREVKFDLTLTAEEVNNSIGFSLEYSTELFVKETVERLAGHYINLIEQICKNPESQLKNYQLITEKEREQLLHEFNSPEQTSISDCLIYQLFEEQVLKTPDKPAVICNEIQLTYQELNIKSNQLAVVLRKKGVKPDQRVGILAMGSFEMIIGIMGVLKAGGAYVPIDHQYPEERILFMIKDSGLNLLLAQPDLISTEFSEKIQVIAEIITLNTQFSFVEDQRNLEYVNTPNDLAYVIYTSGTSGKPKGVMIEHKSLVNLSLWHNQCFAITSEDRSTKYAGFSFDASVWEIFPYVIKGATIYIIPDDIRLDVKRLNEFFELNGITISFLPTQICEQFMKLDNNSLRILLTGGDKLKFYRKNSYQLVNNYGPTENTVVTTCFTVEKEYENIPIGKPIQKVQVHILNQENHFQPIGVVGELCISGIGLARGYLNQPTLTAEKFITNPFIQGNRMYRTGDLARWLADGNIQFVGRKDDQVKIRGFRIELREIEQQLVKIHQIQDGVVVVHSDETGDKSLAAYVVTNSDITVEEIRKELSNVLPGYMIPSYFTYLEMLPLTPNGKVDYHALPAPDVNHQIRKNYLPPTNRIEKTLANIWSEVLGIEKVGIDENFFELGGHSLKATTIIARIHKEFNVEVPLSEFFKNPTIKGLTRTITMAKRKIYIAVNSIQKSEFYPVSSAQRRLFFLNQINKDSIAYNMPGVFQIEGSLDVKKISTVFNQLIKRHGALRTTFKMVDGEPVQVVHDNVTININYREVEENGAKEEIMKFIRPFDLQKTPLIRVGLFKTEKRQILVNDLPHIIADGQSIQVLLHEFIEIYHGNYIALPDLKIDYVDYAVWQNEFLASDEINLQEEYWLNQFKDQIPMLHLPIDSLRNIENDDSGSAVNFGLSEDLLREIRKMAQKLGITIYMFFLAVFNILLFKITGDEGIIIGTPVAGRSHPDLENVIGMFVNTLALRNHITNQKTFLEFLLEVKENTIKAFENQEYPFELLVEKLNIKREINKNPLFDVAFELNDISKFTEIKVDGLKLVPVELETNVSKFDLTLYVFESYQGINFSLVYRRSLFRRETIKDFQERFIRIIEQVVKDPDIKISDIRSITDYESQELLQGFMDDLEEEL